MRAAARLLLLALPLALLLLRRLNVFAKVRIEKQTQGPYTIMYKEYTGTSFERALKGALEDARRAHVDAFPMVAIRFNESKDFQTGKRFWIGVAIHLESAEDFPILFKEYERDFIYKDVYQSCNLVCRNKLAECLLRRKVDAKLKRYTKTCTLEVIDLPNATVRFISDPIIKSMSE